MPGWYFRVYVHVRLLRGIPPLVDGGGGALGGCIGREEGGEGGTPKYMYQKWPARFSQW